MQALMTHRADIANLLTASKYLRDVSESLNMDTCVELGGKVDFSEHTRETIGLGVNVGVMYDKAYEALREIFPHPHILVGDEIINHVKSSMYVSSEQECWTRDLMRHW